MELPEGVVIKYIEKPFEPCTLAEVEKRHILAMLHYHRMRVTVAAKALGVARETIYRKLKEWGLSGRD